ncbi:P-II family nitrogen regulator [Tessaracoccus flavus]|jgi:nitrogen regulatory protein P-II 1|uniref:Nitrogen regulatory protein P-II n=1 Tax=Tessaracoccus flavus TaxID=1610493 RepID=A0A1Q2CC24_9ACTN|nr:P-II family nitrogen regulator [Tessaracoccus flavus]AQP43652.1 transcriptional regulator [Tessaracoccus flavus]SDZ01882.1 nitrogen regulatory protein P-II family [Tessaracoccus flavus]
MRLVTAIVQPTMLTNVQIALARHGIAGMTVTECSGYARQRGHREVYRGAEYTIDFIAKVKIEVLVEDEETEAVIDVITAAARTGAVGDGKVWSTLVDEVVRIRTGERGAAAV